MIGWEDRLSNDL